METKLPKMRSKWPSFDRLVEPQGQQFRYYIGNRLVEDTEGMPILGEDGVEYCIDPQNFEHEGMPGADTYRWSPDSFDKTGEQ
jgi:hypothetical protein